MNNVTINLWINPKDNEGDNRVIFSFGHGNPLDSTVFINRDNKILIRARGFNDFDTGLALLK
jgi:hypothetical protein